MESHNNDRPKRILTWRQDLLFFLYCAVVAVVTKRILGLIFVSQRESLKVTIVWSCLFSLFMIFSQRYLIGRVLPDTRPKFTAR